MELTTDHLKSIVNLIDVAIQRGAYTGEEILTVGIIRNAVKEAYTAATTEVTDNESTPETDGGDNFNSGPKPKPKAPYRSKKEGTTNV